ncbi:MAG: TonB-dependent receptor [Flavobacteriaceae bacterium]|nr:TonB-dependent receptor [Flavobacteriaceae bacterium]
MVLNKKYLAIYFSFFLIGLTYAQEFKTVKKDTTKTQKLEEVVVTAQHNPQSVNRSIYDVKVITKADIKQRAVTNLADLLSQSLNLIVIPGENGRSEVSLFGLDSGYFKILIDNVPLVSESGFGNYSDLDLINTDDIERIEIVEGAMGVQYGSNALTGVINIITKKSSVNNTDISIYLQEETVESEYGWFDKGRHIQSLKLGHNFTEHLYANVSYLRNDFGGYWSEYNGPYYDVDDGKRGHEWLPREMQNTKFLMQYKKDNFKVFYKFDYLREHTLDYDKTVETNPQTSTNTVNPYGLDRELYSNRFTHHLNFNGYLNQIYYDLAFSYQRQTRNFEDYTYWIHLDQETNNINEEFSSRKVFFSRGNFSNLIKKETYNLQLGYEINAIKGYGSSESFLIGSQTDGDVENTLNSYDVFASSEIKVLDAFNIRPGIRMSYSNLFSPTAYYSLSTKYRLKNNYQLRAVIGAGGRIPNYDEVYTYLVDVNHNIQGNRNLDPENGFSITTSLKKNFVLENELLIKSSFSVQYLGLRDKISLVVVNQEPLEYRYQNVDNFTNVTVNFKNEFNYKRFDFNIGTAFLWTSQELERMSLASKDDFLFSMNLNSNLAYRIPKWNTSVSINYKLTGLQEQYFQDTNDDGEVFYAKGKSNAFDFLDANVKTTFCDKKIETVFGVRNVTDRRTRTTTIPSGDAHSSGEAGLSLNYGRSYFLKLAYNLNL